MVSVTISRNKFFGLLGRQAPKLSDERLAEELGEIKAEVESSGGEELSIEVTADRPDLFSVYGIARALKGRLGLEKGLAKVKMGEKPALKVVCEKEALQIRPVVVGAVVRGLKLTESEIASVFQTQEKLDMTLGRKRKRVSIGLYDLRMLKPPFYFRAVDAKSTSFKPLKAEKEMTLRQILEEHPTGKEYAHLLEGRQKLPVLVDSAEEILSLVPIINNVSSAVIPATTEFFIDHTGTDEHACNASLNILCQDFAEAGAQVEKVEVVYPDKTSITPHTQPHGMAISLKEANKAIGMQLSQKQAQECLERQRIGVKVEGKKGEEKLECEIPAYRADFMHPIDLAEEIAIGFGYNNFEPIAPRTFTRGSLSMQTYRENFVRDFMVGAGFTEVSTYALTREEKIERAKSTEENAEILNPVSEQYTVLRASILPNLLEVLGENTHEPYPQKMFELGEVVAHNPKLPEKFETKLHLCAVSCHGHANLTEVASVLNELSKRLDKKLVFKKLESGQFIAGRCAEIIAGEKKTGQMGELHPQVLENFGVQVPASAFEVEIETR